MNNLILNVHDVLGKIYPLYQATVNVTGAKYPYIIFSKAGSVTSSATWLNFNNEYWIRETYEYNLLYDKDSGYDSKCKMYVTDRIREFFLRHYVFVDNNLFRQIQDENEVSENIEDNKLLFNRVYRIQYNYFTKLENCDLESRGSIKKVTTDLTTSN